MQLVPRLSNTVTVVAVHHEDEALRVLEVVPPEGANLRQRKIGVSLLPNTSWMGRARSSGAWQAAHLVLPAHIPDCEADVLVLNCLHVEACNARSQPRNVNPVSSPCQFAGQQGHKSAEAGSR